MAARCSNDVFVGDSAFLRLQLLLCDGKPVNGDEHTAAFGAQKKAIQK
jgi:hypothetical protein